jgi:hypothetical protein
MKLQVLILMLVATSAFSATPTDTTVAFYHGAPDRAGNYLVPSLTWRSAGAVRRDQMFDGRVEGDIYGQPLYWRPQGAERCLIIAATESDFVYALDAATGRIMWRTTLGDPVARAALSCGNIVPLGITGTPVIDAACGALYLDAMINDHGTPRYLVYGLRLADGSVLPGFPMGVAAGLAERGIRFTPAAQNQRGGLWCNQGRPMVMLDSQRGEVCHGPAEAPGRVVRGATLRPRGHPAMRAVVSSVQAQLA